MNIKISKKKGSGGSISKGSGGSLVERDYESLFPNNFIYKIVVSNVPDAGGNGVYTRSSGGTTLFTGPNGYQIIFNEGPISLGNGGWYIGNPGDDSYLWWSPTLERGYWDISNAGSGSPTSTYQNTLNFVFDPAFYNSEITNGSVTLLVTDAIQTPFVNGIYAQQLFTSYNRPFFFKIGDTNVSLFYEDGAWLINDDLQRAGYTTVFSKPYVGGDSRSSPAEVDWSDAYNPDGYIPPVVSTQESITPDGTPTAAKLDPFYLSQIRSYQINNNAVPTIPSNVRSYQYIINAAFNTKKAVIKNNTLSYIKYDNNSDVEPRKYNRNYQSISNTQYIMGQNPPTDNKKPLLFLMKNDGSNILEYGYTNNNIRSCTLNLFIKLQRPISHKNPNDINRIVREKKGIFLTAGAGGTKKFSIGYRSPYYNINGNLSYKLQFEPFSFVFSLGQCFTSEPANFVVMTDYKYKFNTMYMLTMTHDDAGDVRIYINGELQTTAALNFDPLVQPNASVSASGGRYASRRRMVDKINQMPLAPGFIMKNGSTYGTTSTSHTYSQSGPTLLSADINYIALGKSNIAQIVPQTGTGKAEKKRKRYLNNLDIGVINTYNIALSQSDLQEIYNNFRYKYI